MAQPDGVLGAEAEWEYANSDANICRPPSPEIVTSNTGKPTRFDPPIQEVRIPSQLTGHRTVIAATALHAALVIFSTRPDPWGGPPQPHPGHRTVIAPRVFYGKTIAAT